MLSNLDHVLLSVWAVLALVTALLYAYRTSITRDEEDQIFLDDAFAHERAVQSQIVARANRIQPAVRISLYLTVGMTVIVIVYFTFNAFRTLFG